MDARVGCGRPGRGEGTAEPTANRLGSHLVLFKCRQFKLLFWSNGIICCAALQSQYHLACTPRISYGSPCFRPPTYTARVIFLSFARGVWKRGEGGMWRV